MKTQYVRVKVGLPVLLINKNQQDKANLILEALGKLDGNINEKLGVDSWQP